MNSFEFSTANQIVFGAGSVQRLAEFAGKYAIRRALVLTGGSPERWRAILAPLSDAGIATHLFAVPGEPSVPLVREGLQIAVSRQCDGIVAIGGGSVLDAAKAIAALLRNPGDVLDYLEVIGRGRQIEHPSAPWIAIPTTSGTGAEVTRNAVLFSPEHRVKVSLRSPWLLPVAALIDPELTRTLPRSQTLASGMDALTQLIEAYVSSRANPLTDGFCLQGLRNAAPSLERACADGDDMEARSHMSLASLLSGLALANAGLGVVHGFAGPIGGMFSAPHGAICAALLPHGMEANLVHLRRNDGGGTADAAIVERYRIVAQSLTGDTNASAEDGVEFVQRLTERLGVKPLRTFGMKPEHAEEIVHKAERSSSMKANPVKLTASELKDLYLNAL